ncbi:MAG: hypothetical protein A2729_04625 [Candidatus Buchananbacteria bacterium RIFCSPHIGHO2_01_FULL_39_14]|uniref:acylphosphatase n=1 Tax=Candidatus Buchananbacteria bacterium RIFCSPHIGHO2_01_FULL_39_14 TaxID=1797532 RepID=A0A1G1XUY0_9BACT|nr:MAG: hypothetical protein A2729_04625 [Candidatus Buchananbacteria bacterium RIFCSPHIGHO2_01_FULL_39_14]OGY49252.1 MAG: hypothetical protein A3D39_03080 [Candidatus Buchananbacteria bacterium RIFCSPHIGHO2_02_FULL_39_17]
MTKRLNLKIHGLVQGVGFRYLSRKEAEKRGFTGSVHNIRDGGVEIVAEGEETDLKKFIDWCYNGVGSVQVSKIDINWSEATGEFRDFLIR